MATLRVRREPGEVTMRDRNPAPVHDPLPAGDRRAGGGRGWLDDFRQDIRFALRSPFMPGRKPYSPAARSRAAETPLSSPLSFLPDIGA